MPTIIINATAAKTSGALSILKEFVSYIETNYINSDYPFHLFTTVDCFDNLHHITVHKLPVQNWRSRIKRDNGGLKKYCHQNSITPDLIISMQNTCTLFDDNTPQLVYYHQPLPLIPYKWKWFSKSEYKMFLYAHFYKYFVRLHNKNATYVVQLPSIKSAFVKKIKNVPVERVFVIRPEKPVINVEEINPSEKMEGVTRFIYPATPHPYKNHKVIVDAVSRMNEDGQKNIEIIFTVPEDSFVADYVKEKQLESTIHCIGMHSQLELFALYKSSDCLLFPSKIESFGLPLDEATCFGLPVIAADLPYAREVLEGYDNAHFASPNVADDWKNAMLEARCLKKSEYNISRNNSWQKFMDIAESLI